MCQFDFFMAIYCVLTDKTDLGLILFYSKGVMVARLNSL